MNTNSAFEPIFWTLTPEEQLKEVLFNLRTVAIIGLSDEPSRDSYMVGAYLKKQGFRIVPVNPRVPMVLGEKAYPDLFAAKKAVGEIDIVDIFRAPEHIPQIVDDAIEIGAKVIWMQLGLEDKKAAQKARNAGLFVVMDKCMKIEHMKLMG